MIKGIPTGRNADSRRFTSHEAAWQDLQAELDELAKPKDSTTPCSLNLPYFSYYFPFKNFK